ncbi:MAG: hypothetical protein JKY19_05035 [Alcanivoracaceae bacterium]|nr:hypothetical protein [Alcanivoracaceae bacterium]
MDISLSKADYQQLRDNPIKYFECLDYELSSIQEKQIEELFAKGYLLKVMSFTLEYSKY